MHVENSVAQNKKQMAGTGENITGGNVTVELKETAESITKQGEPLAAIPKCQGESSKSSTVHQTQIRNKGATVNNTNKECNDVAKELSNLHIANVVRAESKARNVTHQNDIVKHEHQNISETDDDENATSRNSKAAEISKKPAAKANKSKKPKSKKNKRKKSSQSPELTRQEMAAFNKVMKGLISNEVRRSTLNKMMMSQQSCENSSRTHRTSQGESADSVNGLEEPAEIDCRNSRKVLNGIAANDCSDSVQSLTDNWESLPCSAYSDYHSEDSGSDSGKGGSDIHINGNEDEFCSYAFTFEVPQDLCGALIGKHGRLINGIQDQSNTKIFVRENIVYSTSKLCTIEGSKTGIDKALHLIRRRFPTAHFPQLTLEPKIFDMQQIEVPETMQLRLPEGVGCEVIVSSMLCPGQLFLQLPTHPTYPTLASLVQRMTAWYSEVQAPGIGTPVEGNLCAAPGVNGWYRAKVVNVLPDTNECEVMFVDYGGYCRVSNSHLRQIRKEFFTLPFQSQECFLANVEPADGSDQWSPESVRIFEELATNVILQAFIIGYSVEGNIPLVHLYKTTNNYNTIFINHELVVRGAARWIQYV